MSLEQALAELTAETKRHNALLEQLLSKTPGGAASTSAPAPAAEKAEEKPKAKADPKPKADGKGKADDVKKATLAEFTKWFTEFEADHPETVARQEALSTLLEKLGEVKISSISDVAKLESLSAWLNDPAKGGKDRGFGPGRFAADPEGDGAEDGDSGLDI